MAQDLGLGITISLRDQFSAGSKKVGSAMGRMRSQTTKTVDTMKRMQGAMQAAAGAAIFMAGRRAFGALVGSAANFERGMAEVSTLVDTSAVNMAALSKEAVQLSKNFGIPAIDQAGALYQVLSAGVGDTTQSLKVLTVANKVAIGGVTDVKTAVDGLTTILNAWKLSASDAENVADTLFTTMKLGKTTIPELSNFIFQAAPIASKLGVSLEELGSAIVTMTKQGTKTPIAMTQIRNALVSLLRPTEDLDKIWKTLGFDSGATAVKTLGFQKALEEVNKAAKGNEGTLIKFLGSQEAAQAALQLTSKNAKTYNETMEAMQTKTGATTLAVKKMQETHDFRVAKMRASLEALKITIGQRLLVSMEPLIKKVSKVVNVIDEWLQKHPKIAKVIAGGLGVVAMLGVALGAVAAVMGVIALVSVPMLVVFAKVAAVVGIVVAAFMALKPVLLEIWNQNQDVVQDIKAVWDQFAKAIWPIIKFAAKAFIWWQGTILKAVFNAFAGIIRIAKPVFSEIVNTTRTTVQFMKDAWLIFKTDVLPIFQPIADAVKFVHEKAVAGFSAMVDWVTKLVDKFKEFLNQFPKIQEAISAVKSGVGKGIDIATGKPIRDFVRDKYKQAKDKFFGGVSQRAQQIRLANTVPNATDSNTGSAFSDTSAELNRNLQLSSTRNPNIQAPAPQITNQINVPPAKIQTADIVLDKQKVGRVMFEYQQLQTVRAN